jgi:NtrC-family two-component system response regulator AlgB
MRVLIIDDERNICRTTATLLEGLGHEVGTVADGASALKQLESTQFDIAFLDLRLGNESGVDLLPELLKSTPQLDVVVFTAFASFESAVEAMRRGAADYIPKPFTPAQIRQVLARLAKARESGDAARWKVAKCNP